MTQVTKVVEPQTSPKGNAKDSLKLIRAAAQQLHGAITDATAKRAEAMKADLEAIPQKAKAVAESVKVSLGEQSKPAKKHLTDALKYIEATQKHVAESLKTTGHALEASVQQAVADAHSAARKISEAVAAKSTTESTHSHA